MSEPLISTWTIYESPTDHPGKFVVRRWDVMEAGGDPVPARECVVTPTLGLARGSVPLGSVNLGRQPDDDPAILETWI